MLKWYEKVKNDASCIVAGRVRLARNWDDTGFPTGWRMQRHNR